MVKKLSLLMVLLCVGWSLMAATPKRFTLVIDAGHGGHDTGCPWRFLTGKKDINLSVALRFGKLIESNCPDVKVIYTRKDDRFVTLHERAAIANRNKADLFISVHTNAVARGHTVQGLRSIPLGMHRAKDNLDVAMRENSVISLEKDYEQTYWALTRSRRRATSCLSLSKARTWSAASSWHASSSAVCART